MRNDRPELEAQIRTRLDEVLDPCSTFTQRPQSIVDLGLVEGVSIDRGNVTVDLLPTNQFCMYIPHISEDIADKVGEIEGVETVTVETVADKIWTQDRMTDDAYDERKEYFHERIETHDITPAYDGETWSEDVTIDVSEPKK